MESRNRSFHPRDCFEPVAHAFAEMLVMEHHDAGPGRSRVGVDAVKERGIDRPSASESNFSRITSRSHVESTIFRRGSRYVGSTTAGSPAKTLSYPWTK